jgi:hypothetical protein
VNEYINTKDSTLWYGHSRSKVTGPTFVANILTNPELTSEHGWYGSTFTGKGNIKTTSVFGFWDEN